MITIFNLKRKACQTTLSPRKDRACQPNQRYPMIPSPSLFHRMCHSHRLFPSSLFSGSQLFGLQSHYLGSNSSFKTYKETCNDF